MHAVPDADLAICLLCGDTHSDDLWRCRESGVWVPCHHFLFVHVEPQPVRMYFYVSPGFYRPVDVNVRDQARGTI